MLNRLSNQALLDDPLLVLLTFQGDVLSIGRTHLLFGNFSVSLAIVLSSVQVSVPGCFKVFTDLTAEPSYVTGFTNPSASLR